MNKLLLSVLICILVVVPKTSTVHAAPQAVQSQPASVTISVTLPEQVLTNAFDSLPNPALQPISVGTSRQQEKLAQYLQANSPAQAEVKQIAAQVVAQKFGSEQFPAFATIVAEESAWNPEAVNPTTDACGLPQALPCSKLPDHSVRGQLEWMAQYISQRYGTPENALSFHKENGWY